MAQVVLALRVEFLPAYWALLDCAQQMACTHGEDAALEWAQRNLERDFDLFAKISADRPKPQLRVIEGGR